jgi:hypothetical protein
MACLRRNRPGQAQRGYGPALSASHHAVARSERGGRRAGERRGRSGLGRSGQGVCDNLSYFVKRQTVIDCETIRKDRSGQKIAFRVGRLPQENRLGLIAVKLSRRSRV